MIIRLALPDWLDDAATDLDGLGSDSERMSGVIQLARRNVDHITGGPFSAAVFEFDTGRLIAAAVNVVVPNHSAISHAETMAIAAAGQKLASFDLGAGVATSLYASTEPCGMCLGATVWSGVSALVCAARDEDARAIGFDEGPKPVQWVEALETRGIAVTRDLMRAESVEVLEHYVASGGSIYNGGSIDA